MLREISCRDHTLRHRDSVIFREDDFDFIVYATVIIDDLPDFINGANNILSEGITWCCFSTKDEDTRMHRPNAGSSECAMSSSTTCTTVGHERGSSLFESRYDARSMAGKMSSLAMNPVNTHNKPYVNGAQNAHVSTGAVAIAPGGWNGGARGCFCRSDRFARE